jgi:hypothetical protein
MLHQLLSRITGTTTICNGEFDYANRSRRLGNWVVVGTGVVVGTSPISGASTSTLIISPSSTTTYWVRIVNLPPY